MINLHEGAVAELGLELETYPWISDVLLTAPRSPAMFLLTNKKNMNTFPCQKCLIHVMFAWFQILPPKTKLTCTGSTVSRTTQSMSNLDSIGSVRST